MGEIKKVLATCFVQRQVYEAILEIKAYVEGNIAMGVI
jgi:hypothetical protein